MEELIKDFECHLTLMADDLHDIVSHSNSIVQYIKEHESEWSRSGTGNNVQITPIGNEGRRIARYKIDNNPEGYIYAPTTTPGLNGDTTIIEPLSFSGSKVAIANFVAGNESGTLYAPAGGGSGGGGNDGQDGLSTLFAFKGLSGDSAVETEWGLIKTSKNYPPNNTWSVSSNVLIQEGHMLYMTTAQRQGNNYITTNGVIWQKPVRIGSGSDTSHTGTDDDNYNYIYCRTISSTLPGSVGIPGTSSYGVELLNRIENESNKEIGFKPDETNIDLSNNNLIPSLIDNAWTDHPHGVNPQLPFEWLMGFKKNETSGNWEYYFGPICISHYGHDGLDGDGLEYIFYLQPKNLAGIPSLGAPYEGRIGENGTTTLTNVSVNSTDYQLDDFIPTGWHDNPQTISEEYPRQYVSIRKKEGALEADNLWQAFTPPRLWNIYATNGFLATLNNDSIILDDDNGSEAIEFVSLTKAFLWDGANDVTLSSNYSKVTVAIKCNGFENELRPGYVTSVSSTNVDISPETDWETEMEINRSDYKGFALTKRASGKLPIKTGSITYTIRAYETGSETPKIEASRILTLLVVDINNGVAYQLLVTPNTLGVYRDSESSPYNFRDVSSITVTATAASETSVEKIEIKNGSSNANDKDLYIVVSDSGGTPLNIPSPTWYSDSKSLVYNLLSFSGGGTILNGLQYIVVDLYYQHLDLGIKVDSETVDFSVKGDKGPAGSGSGTESYVITTLNDNAVLDDLTIIQNDLKEATLNTYTVLKGNSYITLDCKFIPTTIELPSQLCLCTYNGGTYNEITTSNEDNLKNSFVLKYIGSNSESITPGNYYYDINIKYGETSIVTKRFKLYVDANISSDGSSYKLYITNDVIYYNYDGTIVLSTGNIIVRAYKILKGTTDINIDEVVANISDISNPDPGKLYLVIGNYLESFASKYNGIVRINRELINYNIDGYGDISLYKGNLLVDGPERIDCIKYGSPGEDGYTVSSDNDNSKFGRYLNNDQLDRVTKQTFTIYKGSNDITSNCTYKVTESNLILSEFKILYSHGNSNVWHDVLNLAFEGENQFRIQLNSDFNGNNFTSGEYYYDVTITYGSYSIAKRHKIIITKDYNTYVLKFVPDSIVYDENGSVLSEKNPYILVYNASGYEQPYTPVELLPNNPNSNINYVVLGPLNEAIDLQNTSLELNDGSQFKRYEVNRNRVAYNNGGYFALLYRGSEFVDGPETLNCTKDKSATYNLEPYPTVLKFNVASDGKTLTPSELIARCKISKKFEDGDPIFYNSSINDYCMFYNITTSDGQLVNISGAEVGSYVIYNNSDDDSAGIHISNNDLDYTRVNFYLAKRPSTMNVTPGGQSYTTSLTPIKQVSVPILRDGLKGDSSSTGQTGRFYYFAGDWNDVTDSGLIVTNTRCPYVYYGGDYYMYIGTDTGNPLNKSSLGNPTGDNWEKMTYNKFAISEAMFSNYAKLGAAIFNRDWMISQYGSVNGVPSTNFSSFDPVEFMCKIKGYAEIGAIYGGGSNTNKILSQLFRLTKDTFKITVTLTSAGGSVKLIRFNDDYLFKDVSGISVITSGADANASVIDTQSDSNSDLEIIFNNIQTLSDGVYCILASNSENVSSIKVEMPTIYLSTFVPNYALDLRSGLTYLNNAYIKGLVSTVNDLVVLKEESQNLSNWATISDRGLFCRNDVDTPSPSLNEVLASIGVHKYTDNYGYTILSGEINLRRRLNRSSNWNYANLNGSGLTFAYHEGNSIPNLTEISALNIKTTLVIAPIIEGGYTFDGPKTPVSFPGNINLNAIVTLPKSGLVPYSGTIIFATNCKIVKVEDNSIVYNSEGQGETYSDTETALINSSALGGTHIFEYVSPRIFVGYYKDNILRWREFCCRQ